LLKVEGLARKYSDPEYQQLYPNQINAIKVFPGAGIAVWGQKTLQTMDSALTRVNVRRLLIVVEKSVAAALRYTLFELNNEFTRLQVTQMINQFMRGIQARNGVYDFKVVCDSSNNTPDIIDQQQMNVDIYLKPQQSAEFIKLQTVITRTSASFEELTATGGNF
jgi:phage tail sheath protein FI